MQLTTPRSAEHAMHAAPGLPVVGLYLDHQSHNMDLAVLDEGAFGSIHPYGMKRSKWTSVGMASYIGPVPAGLEITDRRQLWRDELRFLCAGLAPSRGFCPISTSRSYAPVKKSNMVHPNHLSQLRKSASTHYTNLAYCGHMHEAWQSGTKEPSNDEHARVLVVPRRAGALRVRLYDFPSPFTPDSRGNRLKEYSLFKPAKGNGAIRWLYLCGPDEAAKQILMAGKGAGREIPLTSPDRRRVYTHEIEFSQGAPMDVLNTAALLKEVISLRPAQPLECAIALDWYKDPDSAIDPKDWDNTEMGDLVHRGKYYSAGRARNDARNKLMEKMAWFINSHPLYRDSTWLVTIPGHKGDGESFGEKLAKAVARQVNKSVAETICPSGARLPAKEGASESRNIVFEVPDTLRGDVFVLDDVYRSGTTMRKVAQAAKEAGASRVFGLAAVRTMRS